MVPLLQYRHSTRPQKFRKKQTHRKSGRQTNRYGSTTYQDPKTQNKDQTTIGITVIDLLLVTPTILMIPMTDDHPDGPPEDHLEDHQEDHPDGTHQEEDHLKDHQGIQINGYHAFPEEGHLKGLHKDRRRQGCRRLHCQHL